MSKKDFIFMVLVGTVLSGTCLAGNKNACTSPENFNPIIETKKPKVKHLRHYTQSEATNVITFDIDSASSDFREEILRKAKNLGIQSKSNTHGHTVDSLLMELENAKDKESKELVLQKAFELNDFGKDGNKTLKDKVNARLLKHRPGGKYASLGFDKDEEKIRAFHKAIRDTKERERKYSLLKPQDEAAIQLTKSIIELYQDGVLDGLNADEIKKDLSANAGKIIKNITDIAVENTELKSKASSHSLQKTKMGRENQNAKTFDEKLNFSGIEDNERNNKSLFLNSLSMIVPEQEEFIIRQNEAAAKITQGILELYRDGVLDGLNADEIEKDLSANAGKIISSIADLGVKASEIQSKSIARGFKK